MTRLDLATETTVSNNSKSVDLQSFLIRLRQSRRLKPIRKKDFLVSILIKMTISVELRDFINILHDLIL
jgi:hypothetical protein